MQNKSEESVVDIAEDDLCYAGVARLALMLRSGAISARRLTSAFLGRIDRLDPHMRSYATLMRESALRDADQADCELARGFDRGALHGIPVAIKDLIDSAGVVTAAGMRIRATHVPDRDATVLRRLREAGTVVLGKLTLTEGASTFHHPDIAIPVNPWKPGRSAGFSSSGSGVAVAAGLCVAALGSDTGGSIRIPSAFNALTGVKPTWGRVSRCGVLPVVDFVDVVGPMARSAVDAAEMLTAIAGADQDDPTASTVPVSDYAMQLSHGVSGVTIGIDRARVDADCHPAIAAAMHHAVEVLQRKGARLRAISLPPMEIPPLAAMLAAGMAHAHRDTFPSRAAEYGAAFAASLEGGKTIGARDVAAAIHSAEVLKARLRALFDDVDLLLVPAMVVPPPENDNVGSLLATSFEQFCAYTIPFNVTGSPSITFPAGFDDEGLPCAAQLVGPHFSEALLLRGVHAFQLATDWHARRPPVPA